MMGIYVFSLLQDDYMSPYIYIIIYICDVQFVPPWRICSHASIGAGVSIHQQVFQLVRISQVIPGAPGAQTHDDDAGRQTNPPTTWCDVPSGNDQQFAIENSNL